MAWTLNPRTTKYNNYVTKKQIKNRVHIGQAALPDSLEPAHT